MKALVIVDVQNDFMPGGTLPVAQADKIIPVINHIQHAFDLVVATQDWHPKNHISFASNHPDKKPYETINLGGYNEVLWPDHCIQGTSGAAFCATLNTNLVAAVFRKGMNPNVDSYSGFYDNHHAINTGMTGYLKDKKITELYFCGVAADICVYYTISDAVDEEFSCFLIENASQPLDSTKFKRIKAELQQKKVQIIHSNQIIK
ncbi:bifunctional nicotinamidase/pyrazinamidase [Microbacter margulisiae]|uniref:nicotinamidase n=1 Tax=Microbacter margulisiae TaxID=1350067 RepID=A0A7W5DRU1_9PORP|nr:bifunctional nicotinamidase/pyrazinamidase [Microbacter margulisiae]MBB3187590.1 nicotinamidase/pyrazinamidase [Microbacter margulisiae]